jgi:hypothetical protein
MSLRANTVSEATPALACGASVSLLIMRLLTCTAPNAVRRKCRRTPALADGARDKRSSQHLHLAQVQV